MLYVEEVKRIYENTVTIVYEYVSDTDIYIHSINAVIKQEGNGTRALQDFVNTFTAYNLYVYASSECGTDEKTLFKWYENNGFLPCSKQVGAYNTTHCRKSTIFRGYM